MEMVHAPVTEHAGHPLCHMPRRHSQAVAQHQADPARSFKCKFTACMTVPSRKATLAGQPQVFPQPSQSMYAPRHPAVQKAWGWGAPSRQRQVRGVPNGDGEPLPPRAAGEAQAAARLRARLPPELRHLHRQHPRVLAAPCSMQRACTHASLGVSYAHAVAFACTQEHGSLRMQMLRGAKRDM